MSFILSILVVGLVSALAGFVLDPRKPARVQR
jgi:hypothetical protein